MAVEPQIREKVEYGAPVAKKAIEDCAGDFLHFVDGYCWIEVPNADPIRFRLWKFQARLAVLMQTVLELIILKSRRLGITWLVLAYALWVCTFHPNRYVIILSKGPGWSLPTPSGSAPSTPTATSSSSPKDSSRPRTLSPG